MAVAKCNACEKLIDVEPVKCPYCGVLQPNRAVDSRLAWFQRALALTLGLLLGLGGGFWAGSRARPRSTVGSGNGGKAFPGIPADAAAREAALRLRLREAVAQAEGAGYSRADIEDLVVSPATHMGRELVLAGTLTFVMVDGSVDRLTLMTGFGTGARVEVDIRGLSAADKKDLLASSWPPHMLVVRGVYADGRLRGDGGPPRHLRADRVVNLGEIPKAGTMRASDLLK